MEIITVIICVILYFVCAFYAIQQLDAKGCTGSHFVEWLLIICPIVHAILAYCYIRNWVKQNGIINKEVKFKDLFR